jgi:hypothetical protein
MPFWTAPKPDIRMPLVARAGAADAASSSAARKRRSLGMAVVSWWKGWKCPEDHEA